MKKVWNNRELGMQVKRGLYESVVVPTALYATETWGMKADDKKCLDVMEMRCLRSIYQSINIPRSFPLLSGG